MSGCSASRRGGYGQLRHLLVEAFLFSSRFSHQEGGKTWNVFDLLTVGGSCGRWRCQ